jgi:ferredoxin
VKYFTSASEERIMTYIIAEPCVGTKDKACVGACPVDCIYEADACSGTPPKGDTMLYINPEECIDCGACVDPCPVDAIFAEDDLPDEWADYVEHNAGAFA